MDRSGGDPEDIQVPCMASLEGLKWTSILVLFGRTSCVSFGTSTRRPLNVPFGRPQVQYGRSIGVLWTSTCPLGSFVEIFEKQLITFDGCPKLPITCIFVLGSVSITALSSTLRLKEQHSHCKIQYSRCCAVFSARV